MSVVLVKDCWFKIVSLNSYKDVFNLIQTCKHFYNLFICDEFLHTYYLCECLFIKTKVNNLIEARKTLLFDKLIQHCTFCKHTLGHLGIEDGIGEIKIFSGTNQRMIFKKSLLYFTLEKNEIINVDLLNCETWQSVYIEILTYLDDISKRQCKLFHRPKEIIKYCNYCNKIHSPIFLTLTSNCKHKSYFNLFKKYMFQQHTNWRLERQYTAIPLCQVSMLCQLCK